MKTINQVSNQVRNQVRDQVRNQVSNQVWDQVWSHVGNHVLYQSMILVCYKVKDYINNIHKIGVDK